MPKWVKISLLIIPWCILLIAAINYFAPYLLVQWMALKNPQIINAQLTSRTLDSSYQLPNRGVYYFENLHFDLPTAQAAVKSSNNLLIFNEGDGKKVIVSRLEPEQRNLFSGKNGAILAALLQARGIQTNYELELYQLSLTPSTISPFQRDDLALALIFLPLKSISVLTPPLHSFETPFVKGLQTGNQYRIFTNTDQEYSFLFFGYSQQEIDAILGSLRVQ